MKRISYNNRLCQLHYKCHDEVAYAELQGPDGYRFALQEYINVNYKCKQNPEFKRFHLLDTFTYICRK